MDFTIYYVNVDGCCSHNFDNHDDDKDQGECGDEDA